MDNKPIEDLKDLIVERVDPDELVEVLDLGTEDLVEYLEVEIMDKRKRFEYLEDD